MGNAGDVEYHCPQCGRTLPPGAVGCAHCGWTLAAERIANASGDVSEDVPVKSRPSLPRRANDDQGLWLEPTMAGLWLVAIGAVLGVDRPIGFGVALVSGWFLVVAMRKRERKGCLFALGLVLVVVTSLVIAVPCALFLVCMAGGRG